MSFHVGPFISCFARNCPLWSRMPILQTLTIITLDEREMLGEIWLCQDFGTHTVYVSPQLLKCQFQLCWYFIICQECVSKRAVPELPTHYYYHLLFITIHIVILYNKVFRVCLSCPWTLYTVPLTMWWPLRHNHVSAFFTCKLLKCYHCIHCF